MNELDVEGGIKERNSKNFISRRTAQKSGGSGST